MTIYTLGYSGWKIEDVEAVLERLDAILVDVRMVPRSRWGPMWNSAVLAKRLGNRYTWLRQFGNRNYKGTFEQIEIADFPSGELRLRELIGCAPAPSSVEGPVLSKVEGKAIILFCGCRDVNVCHRKVLADWLAKSWGTDVVHLTRPDNQISSSQPTLF